ncbi:MAG: carbohydrate ABC transporter permease, partial [Firmicutes bacterium]|nr:carbohydrate ABC transporter permease [Bacillota bacterium]
MRGRNRSYQLISLIFVGLAAFFIFPFYWLTIGTTKSVSQLFARSLLPGVPSHLMDNITKVFSYQNGVFLRWMGNSLLYAT